MYGTVPVKEQHLSQITYTEESMSKSISAALWSGLISPGALSRLLNIIR